MTSLAHAPAEVELRPLEKTDARIRLRLLPSGEGWSLVTPEGKLVFRALGTRARRQCLEFARTHGVLALFM
jgi:hypothetical protein